MIVTVEEAKTKRCQEGFAASKGVTVRAVDPPSVVYENKTHAVSMGYAHAGAGFAVSATPEQGPTAPFYCIGPDCMAWQWSTRKIVIEYGGVKEVTDIDIDGNYLGYCGKAR